MVRKPEIKVSMEWEGYDKLFLDMLLEGYETTYWAYLDALKDYNSDPKRYAFKMRDVRDSSIALKAFEIGRAHV